MKIIYRAYSFAGLPVGETRNSAGTRVKADPAGAAGIVVPSATMAGAALKHLETIERMTSDLKNMAGDGFRLQKGGSGAQVSADKAGRMAIGAGDVFIFLPAVAHEEQPGQDRGELIAVKGMMTPETACVPEGSEEDVANALVKDVARKLSIVATGLSTGTIDFDSRQVREKFIISVEIPGGVPSPSIIRHGPSGGTTLPIEDGNAAPGQTIPAEVAAIAAFLKDAGEEVLLEEAPHAVAPGIAGTGQKDDAEAVSEETAPFGQASGFTSPAAAIKGMKEVFSFFFSGNDAETGTPEAKEEGVQDGLATQSESAKPTAPLARQFPGVVVTFVGQEAIAPLPGMTPLTAEDIVEKISTLSGAVGALVADDASAAAEAAGDDGAEAAGLWVPLVKETVKEAVKESFLAAVNKAKNNGAAGVFGMTLDEKGLLKIDKAALAEALSGNSGEAVGFVRDFAGAIHDRLTYNAYNPLAGLFSGTGERVLEAPGGKEGAAKEDADAKAGFEKRLNELQMLLKTSYELKESFIQGRFAQGDGQIRDI